MSTLDLGLRSASDSRTAGPVECLGQSFPSDDARRQHYTARLRAALEELATLDVPFTTADDAASCLRALKHWPALEEAELQELVGRMDRGERGETLLQRWKDAVGFPHGDTEDILRLSDPPYYTACPNPFLSDFLKAYGRPYDSSEPYHREPFTADVSEGKNDPIYNAHSYHTKVPYKAIMRYILHYTEPGDVVFDGFCGTGMTGVAAQMCGARMTVESLGYKVHTDGTILSPEQDETGKSVWRPFSRLGARRAVLNDLSPAATFIAYNYNTPIDVAGFEQEATRVLREVEDEYGWMYATLHKPTSTQLEKAIASITGGIDPKELTSDTSLPFGRINYTVWSDVFLCPQCAGEVVFWDAAIDQTAGAVLESFSCNSCGSEVTKRALERAFGTEFDPALGQTTRQAKQVPVLVNYTYGGKRFEKTPDEFDLRLIEATKAVHSGWFPTDRMMEGGETRRNDPAGLTHIHHFYTHRNRAALAEFLARAHRSSLLQRLVFAFTGASPDLNKTTRLRIGAYFHGGRGAVSAGLSGTLYVPSLSVEKRVFFGIENRISTLASVLPVATNFGDAVISTESSTAIARGGDQLDYIFLDPPFGSNLMYSELNSLWEAWLRVWTSGAAEAVENAALAKTLDDYRHLMTGCFINAYRMLKPGRWMTVEFSNTQASVWNTIQTALQDAGFVVANVSALDKKQGSFKAVTSPTAVKQDLVISAYKPAAELEARFERERGTEQSVWEFIRAHMENLPRFKAGAGRVEFITERDPRILYDRVVAWFVRHGAPVPLSSQEFQSGLAQRYAERDGMYFLPEQVADYDRSVRQAGTAPQQELFVSDERSAVDWLGDFLKKRPSTYADIHPDFMKQIGAGWSKYETRPELRDLLELNFLQYDGRGGVPSQIHGYLSHSYAELRNLGKDDPKLIARAKDRWYVPDHNKAIDLEKLREKQLLKDFQEYRDFGGRKLKVFRLEAVRAGFRKAWQERDYGVIVEVANKLPETVLQEDPLLLRWYDNALTRIGAE